MSEKKIPRAIKQSLLDELKRIDSDVNVAIEKVLHGNTRKPDHIVEPNKKVEDHAELARKLWPFLQRKVAAIVDVQIEDAKHWIHNMQTFSSWKSGKVSMVRLDLCDVQHIEATKVN